MSRKKLFLTGTAIYAATLTLFFLEFLTEISQFRFIFVPWEWHEYIEIATLVGFITGAALIGWSYQILLGRNSKVEQQLDIAKGAFSSSLDTQFQIWGLSVAEVEIARLTIKGFSINEIAKLRQTSEGTIKSQSSAIYKKAGVTSRSQLVSVLIEELLT